MDSKFHALLLSGILVASLEFFALGGLQLPPYLSIPLSLSIIFGVGRATLYSGLTALLRFDFTKIALLMAIAAAFAFALGKYEEAATVIVLYTLAEKLEDIGVEKSRSAFDTLLGRFPKELYLVGKEQPLPVDSVEVGEVMRLYPGELVALDGVVVKGSSSVDESTITGEPIPKDKLPGDKVFAGTLNKQGYLEVEVVKRASDTLLAKIVEVTFEAEKSKAATQQFIEKFARIYTPVILLLAAAIGTIPPLLFGGSLTHYILEALTLIVISCPCALVISTPVSLFSAIGNASTRGVLIKGGRYLEALSGVKAVALDKTRTLTLGKPRVTDVIPFGNSSKEELLSCAAGIEKMSEHPLSLSIIEAAESEGLPLHEVENFQGVTGKGAKAECLVCESRHHCIGKLQFVLEEHNVPNEVVDRVEKLQEEGKTVIVVATHSGVEGIIALSDALRKESAPFIRELKKLKIKTVMLTGDNEKSAKRVGDELSIDRVEANLLPDEKAKIVQELLERYKSVAMVGDGINDAPALALSTVGISLGKLGSDSAIDAASVVLLNDKLPLIPEMIALGKRTMNIIRFNTAGAIGVKLLFILLAFIGKSNLAMAIFADVGVTLLVILNSLRLFRKASGGAEEQ